MQLRSLRHDSYDQFAEVYTPEIFTAVSDIKYFIIPPVILLQNKVLKCIPDVIITYCDAKLISTFWYWCRFLFIILQ